MEIRLGLCGEKRDVVYNRVYTDECSATCCVSTVIQGVCLHLHRKKKNDHIWTDSKPTWYTPQSLSWRQGGQGARWTETFGSNSLFPCFLCISFRIFHAWLKFSSLSFFFFFLETILKWEESYTEKWSTMPLRTTVLPDLSSEWRARRITPHTPVSCLTYLGLCEFFLLHLSWQGLFGFLKQGLTFQLKLNCNSLQPSSASWVWGLWLWLWDIYILYMIMVSVDGTEHPFSS